MEKAETSTDLALRTRIEKKHQLLRDQPELANGHGHARVALAYGLACDVDLGDRSLRVDLPRDDCGTGSGPHPGQLMRASLGACLVMGYKLWAAQLQISVDHVQLELHCDYDERGQLGLDPEAMVGWQRVAWVVTLVSDAPEAELMRLVETTHRFSPMLANLSRDIERSFEVRIRRAHET